MLERSLKPSVVFLMLCYDQNIDEQFSTEARIRRSAESQDILLVFCNSELECLMLTLTVKWPHPQHSYLCIRIGSNLSNARHQFWASHSELETKKFVFSMRLKKSKPKCSIYLDVQLSKLSHGYDYSAHRHRISKGISSPLCFAPQWQMAPIDLLS